jgi:uncharacterized membrane protein
MSEPVSKEKLESSETEEEFIEPLWYPVRRLEFGAPLRWLKAGWVDYLAARRQSLAYGILIVACSYLLTYLVYSKGNIVLLFSLLTGFVMLGPILAFGLYDISCQLEKGRRPRLGHCWAQNKRHIRNELLFAILLLVILLVWARAASMVHVFFPLGSSPSLAEWLQFLAVGSLVGSVFAGLSFMISVVSLPMMLDRGTDAITAALTSFNAVLTNKLVMAFWALLILFLVGLGFATAFFGLAVVIPLIGFATWHAYRDTVEAAGTQAEGQDVAK